MDFTGNSSTRTRGHYSPKFEIPLVDGFAQKCVQTQDSTGIQHCAPVNSSQSSIYQHWLLWRKIGDYQLFTKPLEPPQRQGFDPEVEAKWAHWHGQPSRAPRASPLSPELRSSPPRARKCVLTTCKHCARKHIPPLENDICQ